MATAELEVIKDIPGYKVILKAILKSQIQQLVEQLAAHTEEESVILTASVNDGTLSHLGSDSGKNFLEDHEDIKSQFLGFCLRKHHKKKQQEKDDKEQQEREEALRNLPTTPTRHHPAGPGPRFSPRSPRFPSPRQPGVYPMAMTRAASGGPIRMRHEPYPRPQKRPLSFDPQQTMGPSSSNQSPRMQQAPGKVIKLEADDSDSDNTTPSAQTSSDFPNQTFSSSQTDSSASGMKREASEKDDDRFSTTSSVSNEASDLNPAEGLGLDSDFSGLIPPSEDSSGADNLNQPGTPSSAPQTPGSSGSGLDSGVNVKVEAITESEMELEITGVELGPGPSPQGWGPGAGPVPQMGGATGSPGDMQQGSYKKSHICEICGASFSWKHSMQRHQLMVHGKGGKFVCCGKKFRDTTELKIHRANKHFEPKSYECSKCNKSFTTKFLLHRHEMSHTKENYVTCPTCAVKIRDVHELKAHIRDIHGQVRRYVCNLCQKSFKQRSNLTRHKKTH